MKISLCQVFAIVCILAVGFMTAAPLVQTADADEYEVTVHFVVVVVCQSCGHGISAIKIAEGTLTVDHEEGTSHSENDLVVWILIPGPETCDECSGTTS